MVISTNKTGLHSYINNCSCITLMGAFTLQQPLIKITLYKVLLKYRSWHCHVIGASLSEPHTSEKNDTVNHVR